MGVEAATAITGAATRGDGSKVAGRVAVSFG
jgi:hypothetical protein